MDEKLKYNIMLDNTQQLNQTPLTFNQAVDMLQDCYSVGFNVNRLKAHIIK